MVVEIILECLMTFGVSFLIKSIVSIENDHISFTQIKELISNYKVHQILLTSLEKKSYNSNTFKEKEAHTTPHSKVEGKI